MTESRESTAHLPRRDLVQKITPGLILGFLVLIGLALLGDLKQVGSALIHFNWRVFPLAILLTLFNYTLRFFKWHFYLRQIGIHTLTLRTSLRLFVAGFPLAMTPGKVGEVLKGVWLKQKCGLPVARGVSVVVAERISDGLAVLALSSLGVIAYPQYWPAFAVILALLLGIIIISQIRPAAHWALAQAEKIHFLRKAVEQLREFYEGSFTLFKPWATLVAVFLGTVSWFGEGVGFFIILTGLGLEPTPALLGQAVFILAFSTAVGAVSTLPGGLGASEASIAGMLALLVGVTPAVATSATVLIRLATLWFGMLLGFITWIFSADLLGMKEDHRA